MPKEKVLTDVRAIILKKMKDRGSSLMWLHRKTEIPYDTIYSCLVKKLFSLSQENLDRINEALETDYELSE